MLSSPFHIFGEYKTYIEATILVLAIFFFIMSTQLHSDINTECLIYVQLPLIFDKIV